MRGLKIRNFMEKSKGVVYVIIHNDKGSLYLRTEELTEKELELEVRYFEFSLFKGKNCLEFTVGKEC